MNYIEGYISDNSGGTEEEEEKVRIEVTVNSSNEISVTFTAFNS